MEGGKLSLILVNGARNGAVVPIRTARSRFAVPTGSVTLRAVKRAAKKVRRQQDGRNIGGIVEAIIGPVDLRCGACGAREEDGELG